MGGKGPIFHSDTYVQSLLLLLLLSLLHARSRRKRNERKKRDQGKSSTAAAAAGIRMITSVETIALLLGSIVIIAALSPLFSARSQHPLEPHRIAPHRVTIGHHHLMDRRRSLSLSLSVCVCINFERFFFFLLLLSFLYTKVIGLRACASVTVSCSSGS